MLSHWLIEGGNGLRAISGSAFTISNSTLIEVIEAYPLLANHTSTATTLGRIMVPSAAALAHFLFHFADPYSCEKFFKALKLGENIGKGNPVYTLRERLRRNQEAKTSAKIKANETLAIVFKAWNAYIRGRKLSLLMWRASDEPFPDIARPDGSHLLPEHLDQDPGIFVP